MPKIVVDLERMRVMESGLGQYCRELSISLAEQCRPDERLIYFAPPRFRKTFSEGVKFKAAWRWQKDWLLQYVAPAVRAKVGPRYDLWHITNQTSKYQPWNPDVPVLLTIHDLNFLRERPESRWSRCLHRAQRKVDRATRVTVISQFVADEVKQVLDLKGKQLDVVYNGVGVIDGARVPRPSYAPAGPFLFAIGCLAPKKNFHTLVEMLEHLPGQRLVIAGLTNTPYAEHVRKLAAERGVADRVQLTGPISDPDRHWFFHNCTALLFPSLTEGFGLPPIEAMTVGKPTFISNLTSLPEVGGDAAFYWKDFEPRSMARVVLEGLEQAKREAGFGDRMRRHARRFTWDRAAREYWKIYREMLAERAASGRSTGKRLRRAG